MDWPNLFEPQQYPEYFWEHPEHVWKAEKFGMDIQDVFTTLALQYNCTSFPLLDRDAFCRDVSYISSIAQDRNEFLDLLQKQRDIRQKELADMFVRGLRKIVNSPHLISEEHSHNWNDAMHIFHFNSFDTIVRFFANYLPDTNKQASRTPSPAATCSSTPTDPTPPTSATASIAPLSTITNTRTPEPVPLQSAGQYQDLTGAGRTKIRRSATSSRPAHRDAGSRFSSRIQKKTQDKNSSHRSRQLLSINMGISRVAAAAVVPATSDNTRTTSLGRKRTWDEEDGPNGQPGSSVQARLTTKKRRTDTGDARFISASKKRVVTDLASLNEGEPGKKRRRTPIKPSTRVVKNTAFPKPEYPPPDKAARVSSCPRVTRAQRKLLSGGSAQLFHLGQRGEAECTPYQSPRSG
ncbi:hypothetical protein VM1G_11309 [Cytospora mali]|uniref:Uncharacterized protein n=1 Tax=Cytospora mali TaxID=578113 RepID=A0A194VLL0_CYTMA|nr:hypothetical protein VM1G_11309 [Valsa mali]